MTDTLDRGPRRAAERIKALEALINELCFRDDAGAIYVSWCEDTDLRELSIGDLLDEVVPK